MYSKLAGMTGTALTSAEEFDKVYNLEVIVIPTNKPLIRKDLHDRIYKSFEGKMKAVVKEIKKSHESGQPVLVGTVSIEKNEYLGKLLEREGIPHDILNAKQHEREGEIIAQAGRKGAVTVATNMAGRGVDIVLGGNPPKKEESEEVKKLGGLKVIGTERHEARRIDNQLRGRSGRQGDPGSSQFFVSLEDDLLRVFGGDRVKSLMEKFNFPEDEPIEAKMVSGVIESAQSKIEGMNFDARKHLLEYDDVVNKQREAFYKRREGILEDFENLNLRERIIEIIKKNGYSESEYKKKETEIGEDKMREVEKILSLRILDSLWMSHLEEMDHLKSSVRLRAYGQRDPLVEYKKESHGMFHRLISDFESSLCNALFKVQVSVNTGPKREVLESKPKSFKKPGRNDPCPCGSGKKYKKCCWPKYG
jgi:preprotein translocase subunit SecA